MPGSVVGPPSAELVRLDVGTGACVRIEAVDEPMADALFPR